MFVTDKHKLAVVLLSTYYETLYFIKNLHCFSTTHFLKLGTLFWVITHSLGTTDLDDKINLLVYKKESRMALLGQKGIFVISEILLRILLIGLFL